MENWIKTQKGNYVDVSKAYFLEVGSAQKDTGIEWQIRAFVHSDENFRVIKTFKKEKDARDYLDGIMKKQEYMQFKERKK